MRRKISKRVDSGGRRQKAGGTKQEAGCRTQDVGRRMQEAGRRTLDAGRTNTRRSCGGVPSRWEMGLRKFCDIHECSGLLERLIL